MRSIVQDDSKSSNSRSRDRERATSVPALTSTPPRVISSTQSSKTIAAEMDHNQAQNPTAQTQYVDLTEETPCGLDVPFELEVEAIATHLKLPNGRKDCSRAHDKIKRLMEFLYPLLKSKIEDQEAQIERLKQGLTAQEIAACEWAARARTAKTDSDIKTRTLRETDGTTKSLEMESCSVTGLLDERNNELSYASMSEAHVLRSENSRKDEELQRFKDSIKDHQKTEEDFKKQLKSCQQSAISAEKKYLATDKSHEAEIRTLREKIRCINTKLQTSDNHLEDVKEKFRSLQGDHEDCGKEIQKSEELSNVLKKKLNDTKHQMAEKKKQVTEKNKQLTAKRKELTEKTKQLKSAKKEYKELQASWEKDHSESVLREELWNEKTAELLQTLRDAKGLGQQHNFELSDDMLCSRWRVLKDKIVQFVDSYTTLMPSKTPSSLDSVWQALSPNASGLLQDPMLRPLAFEAYVWAWLGKVVFASGSYVWAGSMGALFGPLSELARASSRRTADNSKIQDYHKWRSNSSNFLSRLSENNINFEVLQNHSSDCIDKLSTICEMSKVDKEKALFDLTAILTDARTFDIDRRKLRADIAIQFSLVGDDQHRAMGGYELDVNFMKDVTPRIGSQPAIKNAVVELCVSPALIRTSDGQGSSYDQQVVLAKMYVLCVKTEPPRDEVSQASAMHRKAQDTTSGHETLKDNALQQRKSQTMKRKKTTQGVNATWNSASFKQNQPETVLIEDEEESPTPEGIADAKKGEPPSKGNTFVPMSTKLGVRDNYSTLRRPSTRVAAKHAQRNLHETLKYDSTDESNGSEDQASDTDPNPRKKRKRARSTMVLEGDQDFKLKLTRH